MSEQQRTVEIEGYRVHLTASGCHVYATESGTLVGTTDAAGKAHEASRPGPIVASLGRLVERIAALAMQPPSPLPDVKVEQIDGCRVQLVENGACVYTKDGTWIGCCDAAGAATTIATETREHEGLVVRLVGKAMAKHSLISVDGYRVRLDSLGAHVSTASGAFVGWCNLDGLYMSLSRPDAETLVTTIAGKALAVKRRRAGSRKATA